MTFTYDGSLEGLLTAIFESYRLKAEVLDIVPEDRFQPPLFGDYSAIETDHEKSGRVLEGLKRKSGSDGVLKFLTRALLSEHEQAERLIHHYVRRQMATDGNVMEDAGDDGIRLLQRLNQQMGREIHRLHQFVRFQETPDGMFVALINPDFNVLPVGTDHFVARYPAMHWLIYDTKRHYGMHWDPDRRKAEFITLNAKNDGALRYLSEEMLQQGEEDYQRLWQTYYKAVDIPERKNLKVHLAHVPRRYHQYLIEKTGR